MVQARVPLHMKKKLDQLYRFWVQYWWRENWTGRDGRSLDVRGSATATENSNHASFVDEDSDERKETPVPNIFKRFFLGAFYQPLDAVEEYFGEQVTFYFAWLQHCAVHLLGLSSFGLLVTFIQYSTQNFDHPIRPFFSMVIMLWSFVVLVSWRKRSNFLAHRWGTMDYKVQETTRPEFKGEYVLDEITEEWVVKYPHWKRWLKYTISMPVSLGFTGVAMLLILIVHANRDLMLAEYVENLNNPAAVAFKFQLSIKNIGKRAPIVDLQLTKQVLHDPKFWVIMFALPAMLGLCMPLMNLILMKISVMLNDFENYRTESEYRTHLIIKVFGFRFVSQLGTLYYYAVISMGSKQAIENGIIRMGSSLLIYTTVSHYLNIFLQVYFFMFIRNLRLKSYKKQLQMELKNIELEEEALGSSEPSGRREEIEKRHTRIINKRLLLDQAQDDIWFEIMNPPHDSFPEYITAVVQFSFVVCFSVVLPITPVFVLFNYLLSMRYDAYKVCRGRQRPLAKKTGGIGVWEHLLHIVVVIAVLTNCWLMGFTSSDFTWLAQDISGLAIFAIVVAWEHVMLLIKYVMQTTISPYPKSVQDALKRDQHRVERQMQASMRRKKIRQRSKFQKERPQVTGTDDRTESNSLIQEDDDTNSMGWNSTLSQSYLRTIPSTDDEEASCLYAA